GYLGADLIGFHTYDDTRHFLSCCKRILGLDNDLGKVFHNERVCFVDAFPMGIDFDKFNETAKKPDTIAKGEEYQDSIKDRKVILSIDRLDYSKGITQRLDAFEEFLEKHQEYLGKIVFILLTVPSRYEVEHYKRLKHQIDERVGNINGRFSKVNWTPIRYIYRSIPFSQLSTLYSIADVAMITPMRDGMNLVSKEYIASRYQNNGVLILSETAGSAKELTDALVVNPNSKKQVMMALKKALSMGKDEQRKRMTAMRAIVQTYNVHQWLDLFRNRLDHSKDFQKQLNSKVLTNKNADFLLKNYQKSSKRLILLDYDGTLMPFFKNPYDAYPDKDLDAILSLICADPKNQVVVVSGRDKNTLSEFLKNYRVDLVAEHGVWFRKGFDEWKLSGQQSESWKPMIKTFLKEFVLRTPGSFIEEKDYSLVWHFRKTDSEFGENRARELVSNLGYHTSAMNLQLLEGEKVIEIKDSSINKGKSLEPWLEEPFDFILAIGDDKTDEDMFNALPVEGYSIKVGFKQTAARYMLPNVEAVRDLLTGFIKVTG
ncbi:MAG: bifunctional alpha,alpha-trehalose-phosphate synthase (UDP-forming)/trehalose-phosphatase, partial [Cytophagales bacterium]